MEFNAEYNGKEQKLTFKDGYSIRGVSEVINLRIKADGQTSDGSHTFDELYHHRAILFSIICNQNKGRAWKSKLHQDGTMYPGYFIVGITTPKGDYTYHYHLDYWDSYNVTEIERAPEWDGHKPEDIDRLFSLIELEKQKVLQKDCDHSMRKFMKGRTYEEYKCTTCGLTWSERI